MVTGRDRDTHQDGDVADFEAGPERRLLVLPDLGAIAQVEHHKDVRGREHVHVVQRRLRPDPADKGEHAISAMLIIER